MPGTGGAGIVMATLAIYIGAALAEIAGCFAFWAWLRLDRSPLWLVPGMASLCLAADTHRQRFRGPRLRCLWRLLYWRVALVALGSRSATPGSLGRDRRHGLSPWCGDHHLGAASRLTARGHTASLLSVRRFSITSDTPAGASSAVRAATRLGFNNLSRCFKL